MKTSEVLVGIDLGTSSVKALLLRMDGTVLAQASREYENTAPNSGWSEQDPEVWVSSAAEVVAEAFHRAEQSSFVGSVIPRGIGVTGQMHSFVLVGTNGEPVRPAITWLDTRAGDLVDEVGARLESAGLQERVGNRPASGLTVPPLLWLSRNEPEVLERSRVILNAKDYLRFRLTGQLHADPSDASAMLLIDLCTRAWLPEVFDEFSIPQTLAPALLNSWESAGVVVSPQFERCRGIPVATGCGDQQAATVATGVLRPGTLQLMLGTGAQVAAPVDSPVNPSLDTLNLFCHHHKWLLQGSVQNSGSALSWIRGIFGIEWDEVVQAAAVSDRTHVPYFLPYLTGERTPIMNSRAGGGWLEMRSGTSRNDLIVSAVEGVAFGAADAVDAVIDGLGADDDLVVRVSGGGSRGRDYLTLMADAIGRPLSVLPDLNATAVGAAILGGVAAGIFETLEDAARQLSVDPKMTVDPQPVRMSQLAERRNRMHELRDGYLSTL